MATSLNTYNFLKKKFKKAEFTGQWLDSIGKPELAGLWFCHGKSGQGKTSFLLQLAKYLSENFGRVAFNSLEQGHSLSLQTAAIREGIQPNAKSIEWLNKAPLSEVKDMLDAHKSPRFIIIDTIQRSGLKYREFVDFMNDYPNKLFIVNSQADRTGNRRQVYQSHYR